MHVTICDAPEFFKSWYDRSENTAWTPMQTGGRNPVSFERLMVSIIVREVEIISSISTGV